MLLLFRSCFRHQRATAWAGYQMIGRTATGPFCQDRAMDHNLWTIFSTVASAVEEREAIVWREQRMTYGSLADRASRLASFFSNNGLGAHTERDDLHPWEAGQDTVGL